MKCSSDEMKDLLAGSSWCVVEPATMGCAGRCGIRLVPVRLVWALCACTLFLGSMVTHAQAAAPEPVLDRGAQARKDAQDRALNQAESAAQSELARRTARIRAGAVAQGTTAQHRASTQLDRQWSRAVNSAQNGSFLDVFGPREVALMVGLVWLACEVRSRRRRARRSRGARGSAA